MARTLSDEDVDAIARRVVDMQRQALATRSTYSCEQFAAEVLDGKRKPAWVRRQCRLRKIITVGKRPWLIPNSEAERFMSPAKRQ